MEAFTATSEQLRAATEQVMQDLNVVHAAKRDPVVVGSQVICEEGQDIDVLVMVYNLGDGINALLAAGWDACSGTDPYEGQQRAALRKGLVNVIVTDDEVFYAQFLAAVEVCKYINDNAVEVGMNGASKDVRYAVHKLVRGEEL